MELPLFWPWGEGYYRRTRFYSDHILRGGLEEETEKKGAFKRLSDVVSTDRTLPVGENSLRLALMACVLSHREVTDYSDRQV